MNLEERVGELEKKVEFLSKKLFELSEETKASNVQAESPIIRFETPKAMPAETISQVKQEQQMSQIQKQPQATPIQPTSQATNHKKKSETLEQKFGQNIMGILASFLIFLGLIFFASLIYQNLSDGLKVVLMFAFSNLILGAGLFINKKKKSVFSISLIGCGLGANFISLIVLHVYFHFVGQIPLYLLLLVWLGITIALSNKLKSPILGIIGKLGISIAIIFGQYNADNIILYLLLVFYFIAVSTIYIAVGGRLYTKTVLKWIISFNAVTLAFLFSGLTLFQDSGHDIILVMISVMLILYLFFIFAYFVEKMMDKKSKSSDFLLLIGYMLIAYINISFAVPLDTIFVGDAQLYLIGVCSIFYWIYGELRMKEKMNKRVVLFFAIIGMFAAQFVYRDYFDVVGFSLLTIAIVLLGYFRDDNFYRISSYVLLAINFIYNLSIYREVSYVNLTLQLILFVGAGSLYYVKQKEKRDFGEYVPRLYGLHKITPYIGTILTLYMFFFKLTKTFLEDGLKLTDSGDYQSTIVLLLIGIINGAFFFSKYRKNYRNEELTDRFVERWLNSINILIVLILILFIADSNFAIGYHILLILVTTVLCYLRTYSFFKQYETAEWIGFYLGIKTTIYINIIVHSFGVKDSFIFSIICLLLAIISIAFGFRFSLKSFRLYGLFLSILSIVKLVIIDISYESSIAKTASFLVCGILCLLINLIYNKMSKEFLDKEQG